MIAAVAVLWSHTISLGVRQVNCDRVFTNADRRRLGSLLYSNQARGVAQLRLRDELEWQLEESKAVQPEVIPENVVTMNSTVRLVNNESAEQIVRTVVYPEDVDLIDDGVSVLEPLGTHLIGCEVGDLIECEDRGDHGLWRVVDIIFQPERVGKFEM